jgi:hypothetical protein
LTFGEGKETTMDYTPIAATLQTAITRFLSTAPLAPTRRAQAAQKLREALKEAEAVLARSPSATARRSLEKTCITAEQCPRISREFLEEERRT